MNKSYDLTMEEANGATMKVDRPLESASIGAGKQTNSSDSASSEGSELKSSPSIEKKVELQIERSMNTRRLSSHDFLTARGVKVYARLQPFPRELKLPKDQEGAYQVTSSTTLFTRVHRLDAPRCKNKSIEMTGTKYTFTEAYGPDFNQVMLFERLMKPQMVNFFGGQNCTVMTYGTAASGKTYTLQGSLSSPGLIPRALQYIFTLKNPNAVPHYKPVDGNGVTVLDSVERIHEVEHTAKILEPLAADRARDTVEYAKMLKRLEEESQLTSKQAPGVQYEVFISFAEIRDETFYDLLSSSRAPLSLESGAKGGTYVKGLSYVYVESAAQAYQILITGQTNLKALNATWNSRSKSHSIFTITLLKYCEEKRPETVQVSRLSFCELAAQEAPHVSRSVLALVKTLRSIYEAQLRSQHSHTEFFCESKLTKLFAAGLHGKEPLSIIVNVNPMLTAYKETQTVLGFTAISVEDITKTKKPYSAKLTTKFGQIAVESGQSPTDWEDSGPDSLAELADQFHDEINALKALTLRNAIQTREEIVNRHATMIERIDKTYKEKLKEAESKARQREVDSDVVDVLRDIVQKLRTSKQMYERELTLHQNQLNGVLNESSLLSESDIMKNEDLSLLIFNLKLQLTKANDKSKWQTDLLNQARDELLRATNESYEKERRLVDVEKKYLALKLERERDLVLRKSANFSYAVQSQMFEVQEGKLEGERKLRQELQAKYDELKSAIDSVSTENSLVQLTEEPEVDASPEPKMDVDPEPKMDANPEPKMDANPEPKMEVNPAPKVDVSPKPESTATEQAPKVEDQAESPPATEESPPEVKEVVQADPEVPPEEVAPDTADKTDSPRTPDGAPPQIYEPPPAIEAPVAAERPVETETQAVPSTPPTLTPEEAQAAAAPQVQLPQSTTPPSDDPRNLSVAPSPQLPDPETVKKVEVLAEDVKALKDRLSACEEVAGLIKTMAEPAPSIAGSLDSGAKSNTSSLEISLLETNSTTDGDFSIDLDSSSEPSTSRLRRSKRKRRSIGYNTRAKSRYQKRVKVEVEEEEGPDLITCDNCDAVIADGNRYHCSICRDGDFDLCPDCFGRIGHHHDVETRGID